MAEKQRETRSLISRRPFAEMTRFEQEVEQMFGDFLRRSLRPFWDEHRWTPLSLGGSEPAVDLYEDKDEIVAKAEVPGITKDDVQVNISDRQLTIKGEKKKEEAVTESNYYLSERSYGPFTRVLNLPTEVQADKVRASFKDGVLEIHLPKTEQVKRKEIKVKVE